MGILSSDRPIREATSHMAQEGTTSKPARTSGKRTDGLTELLENIAAMPEHDRQMATRFHAIIERVAPTLTPRLWYGMPAWAKDGKVLCFFQSAAKFGARYATFGFEEQAALDSGNMWPTSYALIELGDAEEAQIEALIRRAMG